MLNMLPTELSGREAATRAFFSSLDASFLNIDNNRGPLLWSARDFRLDWDFTIPIPCHRNSTVKYWFISKDGDVSFGMRFISDNFPADVVRDNERVASDRESVVGSFTAPRDGTLVLVWDNTFSWFTSKLLSYRLELHQPTFELADHTRCMKSRHALQSLVDQVKRAEVVLLKSRESIQTIDNEVSQLEEKIADLRADLDSKKNEMASALEEVEGMSARIILIMEKKNGLCIRLLSKTLLSRVLAFLGGQYSSVSVVCKYWRLVCCEKLDKNIIDYGYLLQNGGSSASTRLTSILNEPYQHGPNI